MNKFTQAYNEAVEYADSIEAAQYEHKIWKNHFTRKFGELIMVDCINIVIDADESSKLVLSEPYKTIVEKIIDNFYNYDDEE